MSNVATIRQAVEIMKERKFFDPLMLEMAADNLEPMEKAFIEAAERREDLSEAAGKGDDLRRPEERCRDVLEIPEGTESHWEFESWEQAYRRDVSLLMERNQQLFDELQRVLDLCIKEREDLESGITEQAATIDAIRSVLVPGEHHEQDAVTHCPHCIYMRDNEPDIMPEFCPKCGASTEPLVDEM